MLTHTSGFSPTPILQSTLMDLESALEKYIEMFAILGHLAVSRRLVSLRNMSGLSRETRSLWFAWEETGQWPDGEYERRLSDGSSFAEIAEQFRQRWISSYNWNWKLGLKDKVYTDDLLGLTQLRKDIDALDGEHVDATSGSLSILKTGMLMQALDLSLALEGKDSAEAARVEDQGPTSATAILKVIARRIWANQQDTFLAQCARAWPVLKTGALAEILHIKEAKLTALGTEVVDAFETRLRLGRQSPPEASMREILQTISDNTVSNEESIESFLEREETPPTSLFQTPGTDEQIAALETRLGVALPEDYKSFLLASDGFGPSLGGIILEPPLHTMKEVRWISSDETYFTTLGLDLLDCMFGSAREQYPELFGGADMYEECPPVGRVIQIGSEDIDEVWLIPQERTQLSKDQYLRILNHPRASEATRKQILNAIDSLCGSLEAFENMTWCLMEWASGGSATMTMHADFRAFMLSKAVNTSPGHSQCFQMGDVLDQPGVDEELDRIHLSSP